LPESIPQGYIDIMNNYTKDGYRVIGFATRVLKDFAYKDCMRIERLDCEKGLTFLGLLVMENKLKKETIGAIQTLNECKIRTIMATGDNVLTAISVARQCSILSQENEVYLGELVKDHNTGLEKIEWTSS
jgi:cation-transporting P-type ATPase 13A2